jgi:threonine dehydratase
VTHGRAREDVDTLLDTLVRDALRSRVYDLVRETPLEAAPRLSERLGRHVLLKREDLQPGFSFKIRGAYNRMVRLTPAERQRGVVAASAGNHAQGVALSARHLGLHALIVMPCTTPEIKVDAVRRLGADVVLDGDTYADAQVRAEREATMRGAVFVHPFDDPLVIAGQATIALEIVRQRLRPIDAVYVPVGGGGLIAGIGACIKRVLPEVAVIGVEPADADAMAQSLEAGRRVRLDEVGLFADGVAVREVGARTFALAQATVDHVVRVNNDEICAAIKDVFDETRTVLEPSGALSVAGLKHHAGTGSGALVAVLSGANINFDRLRFVAERAELGEAREALFAVTIPERPGAFREFCATLERRVVTEFNYRLSGRDDAHIFVGLRIGSRADAAAIVDRLRARGYDTADLSDNELAKLHVRHMVGGRSPAVRDERICRFEFPERPGALLQFLETLGGRWNISLFHYRNHGADFGRVVAGFEVPPSDMDSFRNFLGTLGYRYHVEEANVAYCRFLERPT